MLATVMCGSFLSALASTRQGQMMPPPLPLGLAHEQSFAEVVLNYVYIFFGVVFSFSQVIIVAFLLYTLYRMYITKIETYLGFKKIVVTIFAFLYPLLIVSWLLLSFFGSFSHSSFVYLIIRLSLSVIPFLFLLSQLFIVSYLLHKLYCVYITKTVLYTKMKKIAVTIFALLYSLPIIFWLGQFLFQTLSGIGI